MKDFLQDLGINLTLSLAGLMGSILMIGKQALKNIRQSGIAMITGVASANYLTPIACDIARIEDMSYQNGIAFVLGFLGLKGVEAVSKRFLKDQEK